MFHVEQGPIECFPGRARASVSSFMAFTKGSASGTLRWARGREGCFDSPPPFLWTPPTPQRIKGCSPLIIPKQKSKRKNASRFAKRIFFASPIDRPLSRCGGSSPQGSGGALSVTFGDTLSPFCRCATSSPDRGKSFKGRGKKRSLHGLGSPFGRAGAKRLRGLVLPQAATDAK